MFDTLVYIDRTRKGTTDRSRLRNGQPVFKKCSMLIAYNFILDKLISFYLFILIEKIIILF